MLPKFHCDTIVAGESLFIKPQYLGLEPVGEPGHPELPVKYITMSVPYNATNFTINAQVLNPRTIQLQRHVCPAQAPQIVSNTNLKDFTEPDSAVYSADNFFPQKNAEVVDEGFYDGCNHIITIAIYPIKYNPVRRQIHLIQSIDIILNFNMTNINSMALKPIIKNIRTNESFEYLRGMVVNPNQVEAFAPVAILNAPTYGINDASICYEYVIITTEELMSAFDRFIAWKRQKGYNVRIEAIEDILLDSRFANGDEISGINDEAGKLRAYLKYYYENHGTRFVLLAGDYTNMPIRYGTGSFAYGSNQVPTDMYFSDFNSNWNINGNDLYGEKNNKMDYYSEVYIGRLLCTTSDHIKNYTEKLIKYELNPGNGDYSYLKKFFSFEQDNLCSDSVYNILGNIFIERKTLNDIIDAAKGTEVIREMNNRYGFFSWHGHGNPGGITTIEVSEPNTLSYGINAIRGVSSFYADWNSVSNKDLIHNGLDDLTNYDYPAIAYSISCSITPFDIYIENGHQYNLEYNMGSSYTVAGLYGGPALLGNTRVGWRGSSERLEEKFVQIITDDSKRENKKIGFAESLSKSLLSSDHHVKLTHHLIGEPEFEMWTGIPTKFSNVTVSRTNNTISVSCTDTDSCYFSITDSNGRPSVLYGSGSVTFPYADPNSVVMVYKHNYIPYIAPLYMQNAILEESRYVIAEDVYIGSTVDSGRTIGNYIVGENGELTIEASGDVILQNGFVVDSGGIVYITTNGKVVLSGGVVKPGGVLEINASSVSATSGLIVEKGGVLDINK